MVAPLLLLGLAFILGGTAIYGVGRTLKEGEGWYPGKDFVEDVGKPLESASELGKSIVPIVALLAIVYFFSKWRK